MYERGKATEQTVLHLSCLYFHLSTVHQTSGGHKRC